MKKIYLIAFLLTSLNSFAQLDTSRMLQNFYLYGQKWYHGKFQGGLIIPGGVDTTKKIPYQIRVIGSTLWFSNSSGVWTSAASGSGGTTYTQGYGILIASSIIKADSIFLATRLRVQKGIDSLGAAKANVTHTHGTADVNSGQFPTGRLGSGTATSSTFLNGAGEWSGVPQGSVTNLSDSLLVKAQLVSGKVPTSQLPEQDLGALLLTYLASLPGWTTSGTITLKSVNGTLTWVP